MTTQENKILVRRYFDEALNQRNAVIVDEIFSESFVAYAPRGATSDLKAFKNALTMSHKAFPDLHVTIEDQIAEGDKVTTRWQASGTHLGTFAGLIPPTKKPVTITALHVHHVVDGKIVALWEQIDLFGLFQQLGFFPPVG